MSEQDCPNCHILSAETRQQVATALGAREVRAAFSVEYLATVIAARYDDATYSALRVSARRDRDGLDPDWLVMALRKAPRHSVESNLMIQYEDY